MKRIIKIIWIIPILSLVTPLVAFLISIYIYITYDPSHHGATPYLMVYMLSMFIAPAIGIIMLSAIFLFGALGVPKLEKKELDRTTKLAVLNVISPVWLLGFPLILALIGMLFGWAL